MTLPPWTRLQNYLLSQDIHLLTACGRRGNCGKCRVKAPGAAVNAMDRVWFSEAELNEGWRLGCQVWSKDAPLEAELPPTLNK